MGVVDCVCGGVGDVLAVNVEAVECRNIGHVCALNRFQKRCFTTFCSVLFVYVCHVELSICPFYCGIRVTQKTYFYFMHLL